MKKIIFIISAILAAVILISAAVLVAGTEEINIIASGDCGTNVKWSLDSTKTLTITGTGKMNYSGDAPWYNYRTNINTAIIEKGITSIANYAFYDCTNLMSVGIPDSVTSIEGYAFYGCTSLVSIDIPYKVISIGVYAFYECTSLTSVDIPDSVISIGEWAFSYCTSLTSVELSDRLTSIGMSAFRNCTNLTTIEIPASVTSINNYVFLDCTGLLSINVNENNKKYSDIDGVLFNKDKTKLIVYPGCKSGEYSVPDTVTSINAYAFSTCINLTSVDLSNAVFLALIDNRMFDGCTSLTSVYLPDSGWLTSIGNYAFRYCTSLKIIDIPYSVTSIGVHSFSHCTNLKDIRFYGDAPSIDYNAFYKIDANVYYPLGNTTWTTDVRKSHGGKITWRTFGEDTRTECEKNGHKYDTVITPPTYTEQGYTTHICTVCDDSYIDSYTDVLEPIYGDLNYDGIVNVDDVLICLDLCFEN